MAIKSKISKTAYNALEDSLKEHYKISKDGGYELDIDGELPAVEELRRAKSNEVTEHAKTKEALANARAELETLNENLANVSKVKETEIANIKAESESAVQALTAHHKTTRQQEIVTKLASEIFGKNVVLGTPHLEKRIEVSLEAKKGADGKLAYEEKVRYLDASGKETDVVKIKEEFLTNSHFSAIVQKSAASGGGPAPKNTGGTGSSTTTPVKESFSEMRSRVGSAVRDELGLGT